MPTYEYRCNTCGRGLSLFYKTYKDYDAATPVCSHCQSNDLTRTINSVAIPRPSRDYTGMSSGEMLNVMEGGESHEVGQMFKQLGQDEAGLGDTYHQVTERLLGGDKPAQIERDLQDSGQAAEIAKQMDQPPAGRTAE
jgi:putative FmdB family regulatory protein